MDRLKVIIANKMKPVLRGHPNPANEGHLKTGQR
jgi:hypothetical protein